MGALCACLATSAHAGDLNQRFSIGGWTGNAYASNTTGAFTHCGMWATYKSGITLHFAVRQDFSWAVGLVNEAWKLPKGNRYPVRYFIDRNAIRNGEAAVNQDSLALIEMPDDSDLFRQFQNGRQLTILANGQEFNFDLDGTSGALGHLIDCVNLNRKGASSSNPFAASQPGLIPVPPPPPPAPPATQAETMTLAANLISLGALPSMLFFAPNEIPDLLRKYDVAMRNDRAILGIRAVLSPNRANQDHANYLAAGSASDCVGGQFATQPLPEPGTPTLGRAASVCKLSDTTVHLRYTVVSRKAGGVFEFVLMTVKDQSDIDAVEEPLLTALRAAVKSD